MTAPGLEAFKVKTQLGFDTSDHIYTESCDLNEMKLTIDMVLLWHLC